MQILARTPLPGILLASFLLLAGCGGGSGGNAAALKIVSTSIQDGESQVGTTPVLSATFSSAVDPATVNVSSFVLADEAGTPISGRVSFSSNRTVASFTPDAPLAAKGLYTATLTTAIRGASGTTLSSDYRLAFHTGLWTRQYGSGGDESANDIAVDSDGNIVVAGSTTGTVDNFTNSGGKDILLVRYRSNGLRDWTRVLGTATDDIAHAVVVDGNGNIYVCGETGDMLDGQTNAGGKDVFLIRYDPAGNRQWTRLYGTAGDDVAFGLALDSHGHLYLAGSTSGSLDGSTSAIGNDAFVMQLDTDGNPLWIRQLGSTSGDETAMAIASDSSGNAYLTGTTNGDLDGNPIDAPNVLFLAAYDDSGNPLWKTVLRTPSSLPGVLPAPAERGSAIALDSAGNIYVAGDRLDLFGGTAIDMLLARFDASGQVVWVRMPGTSGNDLASAVLIDDQDNLFIAGQTDGVFPGATSSGSADPVLLRYAADGTETWIRQAGTSSADAAHALALTATGKLLVCGETGGGLDGNTSSGGIDLYIRRQDRNGVID